MQNNEIGKYTWSFGVSVIVTSIFSALLVVVKESTPALLGWMKSLGHHWAIHGVMNIIVFLVVGFAVANMSQGDGSIRTAKNLITGLAAAVLACTVIIAGFYLLEG